MIVFTLRCAEGHGFEGWFRDNAAFDAQAAGGEITCPVCGDSRIAKAPMAPRIARSGGDEGMAAALRADLAELRRQIEANCDYVGDRFAEEARRIHYGEAERRNIYGEATDEQTEALRQDDIPFARIPWPARTDS